MKLNDQPIEIQSDGLKQALVKIFEDKGSPQVCIETGAFIGMGSTRVVIDAFEEAETRWNQALNIYTIEANPGAYEQAVRNLEPWPWVHVVRGLSLARAEAEGFIMSDGEFLNNEELDIYKDTNGDPQAFYMTEISPAVVGHDIEENLLETLIDKYKHKRLMFFLDSCGGLGWKEFLKVRDLMGGKNYLLIFDDRNHVKHYRTYQYILNDELGRWEILYDDGRVVMARW